MKKTTFVGLIILAMAVFGTGFANAQTNGPTGISVRLGAYFPTNSLGSDLASTWFAGGIDYKLNTLSVKAPITNTEGYFGISADYYGHGGDNDIPVALTYNLRQGQIVFSAGIGPDFRNATDLTDNGVGIAEQVGIAYEFVHSYTPVFIAAKYFFASKPELSGAGVYLGIRF